MKTKLTKGLTEDEAKEVRADFISASRYRKQLVRVLNEEIDSLSKDMLKDEHYKSPNWNLIQVDRLAQQKALKKIISLFEN